MQIKENNLFSDNRNSKDSGFWCLSLYRYSHLERELLFRKKHEKIPAKVNVIENNYILIVFSLMKQFSFSEKKLCSLKNNLCYPILAILQSKFRICDNF